MIDHGEYLTQVSYHCASKCHPPLATLSLAGAFQHTSPSNIETLQCALVSVYMPKVAAQDLSISNGEGFTDRPTVGKYRECGPSKSLEMKSTTIALSQSTAARLFILMAEWTVRAR